jgi:hypothetical protein
MSLLNAYLVWKCLEAQEQCILSSNCDFLNLVGMKYSMVCEAKQESFIESGFVVWFPQVS